MLNNMDERKLNIDAPLLSVRRSAISPSLTEGKKKILEKSHTLPYHKPNFTMNQVTEPVTVPFNWEHIPGRCKGDGVSQPQPPKDLPIALPVDYDDVYSDALDTMAPSESFSINCSVSGISGLDNMNANKSGSGTYSTDPKARDFMMNRFLPAAKAMTLQTPQYPSRKQSVAVEPNRETNRLIREEKKHFLKKHIADIIQYSGQCQMEEESEDDYQHDSAKGCGMFPQLRIRNSLCLLNPIPGMKMRNQVPLSSSAYEVGKPNKGSNARSHSPAPAVKKALDAICKNKSSTGVVSSDLQEVRKKWISQSCRFNYSGESQQQGRLSPFRRSRAAAGVSPCRSRPQYPFRGARMLGDSENNQANRLNFQSKGYVNIPELMMPQETKKCSNTGSPADEKTLYIDTASTVKLLSSHSCSLDDTRKIETPVEDLDKRRGKENDSAIESPQGGALEEKNEDSDVNSRQIVIADNSGNGSAGSFLCPLPPPLPKSPSESWLWRALPLVSARNSLLHSHLGTHSQSKTQDSYTKSSNTMWEAIVKTSNLNDDHVRYSQELITTHISQHLKP